MHKHELSIAGVILVLVFLWLFAADYAGLRDFLGGAILAVMIAAAVGGLAYGIYEKTKKKGR